MSAATAEALLRQSSELRARVVVDTLALRLNTEQLRRDLTKAEDHDQTRA